MMRTSDKISAQFDIVQNYLDLVDHELQKLTVEFVYQATVYNLHNRICELLGDIEELHYETCMPLEMREDERDEEIRILERRLAELKAQ
jgi:hypothetical protein